MHLSKIHVAWTRVRNSYDLHRVLWMLFPGHERDRREFLFRVETERRGVGLEVLVQSAWPPIAQAADVHVLASRPYLPKFSRGQLLRFRLTCNPVKTIKDERGRRNIKGEVKACRVPLIQEEQQLDWLRRKLETAAYLETAVVHSAQPLYFRKGDSAGKVVAVTFDGVLQVNDPIQLWQQMQLGIGPAKGFGCGLLSIARV